jgi:hypothetical protein
MGAVSAPVIHWCHAKRSIFKVAPQSAFVSLKKTVSPTVHDFHHRRQNPIRIIRQRPVNPQAVRPTRFFGVVRMEQIANHPVLLRARDVCASEMRIPE